MLSQSLNALRIFDITSNIILSTFLSQQEIRPVIVISWWISLKFAQVTNVSKVVREVSHMEPDPGAVSYMSVPLMSQDYQHADRRYPADSYMVGFEHYEPYLGYPPQPGYPGPHGIYMPRSHSPHSPHSPSEHSRASPPHGKSPIFIILHLSCAWSSAADSGSRDWKKLTCATFCFRNCNIYCKFQVYLRD